MSLAYAFTPAFPFTHHVGMSGTNSDDEWVDSPSISDDEIDADTRYEMFGSLMSSSRALIAGSARGNMANAVASVMQKTRPTAIWLSRISSRAEA
jgi:hypothetical protein